MTWKGLKRHRKDASAVSEESCWSSARCRGACRIHTRVAKQSSLRARFYVSRALNQDSFLARHDEMMSVHGTEVTDTQNSTENASWLGESHGRRCSNKSLDCGFTSSLGYFYSTSWREGVQWETRAKITHYCYVIAIYISDEITRFLSLLDWAKEIYLTRNLRVTFG